MHSQELHKKNHAILFMFTQINEQHIHFSIPLQEKKIKKGWFPSLTQQLFKDKEAKEIFILAMVNPLSGKYSEKSPCLEYASCICSYKVAQQLILIITRLRF